MTAFPLAARFAPDHALLARFADAADPDAFAALVRRPGPTAPTAAPLTEGVLRPMMLTKVKNAVVALSLTAAAATAAGAVVFQAPADPASSGAPVASPPAPPAGAKAKLPAAQPPAPIPALPDSVSPPLLALPVPPTPEQLRAQDESGTSNSTRSSPVT